MLIKSNRTALQTYKVEERTFGTPCNVEYRISSNNRGGRLFFFLHQNGAIIRGKATIRERRLFQIIVVP